MVPALIGAGAALLGGAMGTIGSAINNSQNLAFQGANLDYQKALQQEIFKREDTAIQRRKNDLIAAGFNPYLAMNDKGAGAGAVVSTTPQHSEDPTSSIAQAIQSAPGAAIDMLKSLEEYKQAQLHTTYMTMQNRDYGNWIFNEYAFKDSNTGEYKSPDFWNNAYNTYDFGNYRKSSLAWARRQSEFGDYNFNHRTLDGRWELFQNELQDSQYNLDLLKVRKDFAVSDKIEGYIMDLIGAVLGGASAYSSVRNSDTNRYNAQTNRYNAQTNRMNAHTNRYKSFNWR